MNDQIIEAINEATNKFKSMLLEEADMVDISNVNYEELQTAILDEFQSEMEGVFLNIIVDLHDSIGLEKFGFVIK